MNLFHFDNSYARLPGHLYARLDPTPVKAPRLVAFNHALARELGADGALACSDSELAAVFAGNVVPDGAEPLAMAYAGHQFGHFVPQLGDGRALLLGEVVDVHGRRRDIQLKGSGRTPYSRGGDGRSALGPVLREYLVSEAMHALGVPTTRALAAVTSGEQVYRDLPRPGGVFTRVAASHLRVGTFQYFAARRDTEALRTLADHAIARHYPAAAEAGHPVLALLEAVGEAQAALVARWLQVGFIHGVMNTDNTALSGETIDYGPCAFMDAYDPATVFSSIDHGGRYAFGNQPGIAQWNLARFAETLLPLIDDDPARAVEQATPVVEAFAARFEVFWLDGMRRKLGLSSAEAEDDDLVRALLEVMRARNLDYTDSFRRLGDAAANGKALEDFGEWAARWLARLARDPQDPAGRAAGMRAVNPAVIPRNHRVEEALSAAVEEDDFAPFEQLLGFLQRPFEPAADALSHLAPPVAPDPGYRTFCGT